MHSCELWRPLPTETSVICEYQLQKAPKKNFAEGPITQMMLTSKRAMMSYDVHS